MKVVPLKTIEMGEKDFSYREQLMEILVNPAAKEGGTKYKEMCEVIPIYQKLKEVEGEDSITLENEEHKVLCDRLKNTGFMANSVPIFEFITDIIEAPDPDKPEK